METLSKNIQISNSTTIYPVGADLFHADTKQDRHVAANSLFFFRNFTNVPRKKLLACLKAHFPAA